MSATSAIWARCVRVAVVSTITMGAIRPLSLLPSSILNYLHGALTIVFPRKNRMKRTFLTLFFKQLTWLFIFLISIQAEAMEAKEALETKFASNW
jgi:hypothetical protein